MTSFQLRTNNNQMLKLSSNLSVDGGGDSIHLFKELFSQPKLKVKIPHQK